VSRLHTVNEEAESESEAEPAPSPDLLPSWLVTALAAALIIGSVAVVITGQQVNQKIPLLSRPQLHNRRETS